MKIIKFKKKNTNQYTVEFSDNTSLNFYDDTILYFNLLSKKEISKKELEQITNFDANYKAYYKALKLITTKLRTEKELVKLLQKNNFTQKNIDFAIDRLKSLGYINNELYLKSYINDQLNLTLNGPRKITKNLEQLGFDEIEFISYLPQDNTIWQEKIEKIISKKSKTNKNLSLNMLKRKIKTDLLNLGYNEDLIEKNLSSLTIDNESDIIKDVIRKEYKKLSRKYDGKVLEQKLKQKMYLKGFSMTNFDELLSNIFN